MTSQNFTIPAELPTVTISRSVGSNLMASANTRARIDLSEVLKQPIKLDIVADGTADYADASGDWAFQYRVLPEGQEPPSTFGGTLCGSANLEFRH